MSDQDITVRTIELNIHFTLPTTKEETLQKGIVTAFILENFFHLPLFRGLLESQFSCKFLWNREEGLLFPFHLLRKEETVAYVRLQPLQSIINLDRHDNLIKFLKLRESVWKGDTDNLFWNEDLAPIVDSDATIYGVTGQLLIAPLVRFFFFSGGMLWVLEDFQFPRRKRDKKEYAFGKLKHAI